MTETDAQIDVDNAEASAAVAAEMRAVDLPVKESEFDQLLRILDREQRDARIREREQREAAAREQARRQREEQQRADQVRQEQAARAAAQRALAEQAAERKRESDARFAQERLAYVESQLQAEQARRQQAAREKAAADHWREMQGLFNGLSRFTTPPPRDVNAERIAALESELAFEAERNAADAERRRSQQYQANQRAVVARRESRGW
jgi:hypothetical protein